MVEEDQQSFSLISALASVAFENPASLFLGELFVQVGLAWLWFFSLSTDTVISFLSICRTGIPTRAPHGLGVPPLGYYLHRCMSYVLPPTMSTKHTPLVSTAACITSCPRGLWYGIWLVADLKHRRVYHRAIEC
ncbi:hypothetical protein NEOLEDRAFT_85197 [Neolentinus lepideus HHB14362 ss-1]|uniref:Uncharacterized protein n=1 Tax=Neolentinus lepideus HHB14362 ss-1 TaxID=1314782 RepID=A0A165MYJ8_9AGAM|nr:hypothetical protein NEOLEDRAFT_85197 [Neolentinus lepideus HHB14362 ss-1]